MTANNYFSIIPEFVLDSGVSEPAYRLYGALGRVVNKDRVGFARIKDLAARLNRSERSIKRDIKELVDAGLVLSQRQWTDDAPKPNTKFSTTRIEGWRQTMNRYTLVTEAPKNPANNSTPVMGEGDTAGMGEGDTADTRSYNPTIPNPTNAVELHEEVELAGVAASSPQVAPPWEDGPAPTWYEHETELVESVLGALASLPPSMDSTTPDITGAKVFIRDGVEVLAADPTLAPGVVLPERKGWSPSQAALATARSVVVLKDIPISIARYEIVKAEKREAPSSAEWLRWLLADEEKLKAEQVKTMTTSIKKRRWDSVAE